MMPSIETESRVHVCWGQTGDGAKPPPLIDPVKFALALLGEEEVLAIRRQLADIRSRTEQPHVAD